MFVCLFVEGAERGLSRAVGRPTPRGVYPELEQGSSERRKFRAGAARFMALWRRFSIFGFRFSVAFLCLNSV